jgi:hypothetical protein
MQWFFGFSEKMRLHEWTMDALFKVYRLNSAGQEKAKAVAKAYDDLLAVLRLHIPEGRELTIVGMKLEEACFYSKKAIANDPANR